MHGLMLLVMALAAGPESHEKIQFPLPVRALLAQGKARLDCSKLDIGTPEAITDGDPETLARSAAVNPAFVTLVLEDPVTVEHLRLVLSDDEHRVSLAAADSPGDLEAHAGSYRLLADGVEVPRPGRLELDLPRPVRARAFRLDVDRLTGDDYVHLFEWDLTRSAPPHALAVERLVARRLASKGPEWDTIPDRLPVTTPGVVVLRVWAEDAGGQRVDVTPRVAWRVASEAPAAKVTRYAGTPGGFLVEGDGRASLTACLGGLERRVGLEARRLEISNTDPDLEICFIERLPRLDLGGPHGGWPAEGQSVVWRAHVKSWGDAPVPCRYTWQLDGKRVKSGRAVLAPSAGPAEMVAFDLARTWRQDRHGLEFTIEPVEPLEEVTQANNRLAIQTDALAVGYWVETSLWAHHHDHQRELNDLVRPADQANSFAGWAQRGMKAWNEMFEAASFPEVPDGIRDRVRLDRLVIVPDFALPLDGGLASNNPARKDKTVDLMWGFPSCDLASDWWSPEKAREQLSQGKREGAAFSIDFALFHELGHARYLIDAYGFDVHARSGQAGGPPNIQVSDQKGPILGRYMPAEGIVHWRKQGGQMGGDYTRYGLYEALMLNRIAGQRARKGNQNAPADIGEFLQEIPERLVYVFEDAAGKPLAKARVQVHRARPKPSDWYGKTFVDPPDLEATADRAGRVVFDRTLFAADGKIVHGYGYSNGIVLLCIISRGQHDYLFEEVTDANIAYALGEHDEAVFERRITLRHGEPTPDEWQAR